MSIVCVCLTVKIQLDNTKTFKYSIILHRYVPSHVCPLPPLKNSGSAPVNMNGLC